MDRPIIVVDANKAQCQELCNLLEQEKYRTIPLHSLMNLEKEIKESSSRVVILDLDTLPVDNRFVMGLRKQNPGVSIMGLSSRPFHPELKEAISTNISACLGKPPDPEELIYCLRSFCEDGVSSRDAPEGGGT